MSAYGRSVVQIQAEAGIPDMPNGGPVGIVDPANPPPELPSESDPDGGPVGRETRRRLMEWWQTEYCAGRMRLAVLGRGEGEYLIPSNTSDAS